MPKVPPGNSAAYQQLLVDYLLIMLESPTKNFSEVKAQRMTGLGSSTLKHIKERLRARGSLESGQSAGGTLKYTDDRLELTLKLLRSHCKDQLNLTELLALAVCDGIFEEPVDRDNFSRHLQTYVHAQGGTINTTSTKTLFFIPASDKPVRLKFAREKLDWLQREPVLKNIVFIDETSELATCHPKGKWMVGRAAPGAMHVITPRPVYQQYSNQHNEQHATCSCSIACHSLPQRPTFRSWRLCKNARGSGRLH